jgi:hypothetical protein
MKGKIAFTKRFRNNGGGNTGGGEKNMRGAVQPKF